MKLVVRILFSVFLLPASVYTLISTLLNLPSFDGEKLEKVVLNADDLVSGKVEIVGVLSRPYGEISNIRGIWKRNENEIRTAKGPKFVFLVTHIENKPVGSDLRIISDLVIPLPGSSFDQKLIEEGNRYEGRVYEAGGYLRKPSEVLKILGEPVSADPLSFGFHSFVYLID